MKNTYEKVTRIGQPEKYVDPRDRSKGRWIPVHIHVCVT